MIQIDKPTLDKLARMRELHLALSALFARERFDDKMVEERNSLQGELVEAFMPLLTTLAEAGLLTASIDGKDYLASEYGSIAGEAVGVFANGNIWIHAADVDCACARSIY